MHTNTSGANSRCARWDTNEVTGESPEPAWENEDIPDDLVPNRTDLEGGPRQCMTERLKAMLVRRPDPRLVAARIDAARFVA